MRLATENLFPLFAQPFPEEGLTATEARDVLLILSQVAESLARTASTMPGIHRRLDAIAGAIIAFMDQLDGDCDLEDGFDREAVCEDEGAQCDDEGAPDDNGLGDSDGLAEQLSGRHLHGGHVE